MESYYLFTEKDHLLTSERLEGMHKWALPYRQMQSDLSGDQPRWTFSERDSQLNVQPLAADGVDAWADRQIDWLSRQTLNANKESVIALTEFLLKTTLVVQVTVAGEAAPDFLRAGIDGLLRTLVACARHGDSFYDRYHRVIASAAAEPDPEAEVEIYVDPEDGDLPFHYAALGKLDRLRAAIDADSAWLTATDPLGRTLLDRATDADQAHVINYLRQ